jgi:dTDP-4-dehydrorhamnose 3,5-epimerase
MNLNQPLISTFKLNSDERGSFSTLFTKESLSLLNAPETYISISRTKFSFTIRGMHFQEEPYSENKLVTVLEGSITDVLIDLRALKQGKFVTHKFHLDSQRPEVLFIPRGFAHGYQTLADNTVILYALDSKYKKNATRGFSPLSDGLRELWLANPELINEVDLKWPKISL